MNAAILVLSSAIGAGGEVIPAGWGESGPAVVRGQGCCPAPAPSCCDPCGSRERVRLLDRLRARFGSKSSSCCDPCANAAQKPGLLDRLRDRLGGRKTSCCQPSSPCCQPASPCGPAGVAPPAPVTPVTPPKDMPKPKELPKDPKGTGSSNAVPAPPAPLPAVRGTGTTGTR